MSRGKGKLQKIAEKQIKKAGGKKVKGTKRTFDMTKAVEKEKKNGRN